MCVSVYMKLVLILQLTTLDCLWNYRTQSGEDAQWFEENVKGKIFMGIFQLQINVTDKPQVKTEKDKNKHFSLFNKSPKELKNKIQAEIEI